MKPLTVLIATTVALSLLMPLMTHAQEDGRPATETFKVDSVHSSIVFRIKHLDTAWFYGRFNKVSGEVTLSHKDPARTKFDITVEAASVDTANKKRDDHLRSKDFFHVDEHPEIRFVSKQAEHVDDDHIKLTGELTLHGVTRPLTVTIERTGQGEAPMGDYRAGFHTEFTVKRSEFGIDTYLDTLGDEVRLTISLETVRQ